MTDVLFEPVIASEWPCAHIHETATEYNVEVETPGFGREDLIVEVEGHTLRVLGKPEHAHEGSAFDFIFTVPADAVLERMRARFVDGVLTVSTPLRRITGRRTLEIETPHLVNGTVTGL